MVNLNNRAFHGSIYSAILTVTFAFMCTAASVAYCQAECPIPCEPPACDGPQCVINCATCYPVTSNEYADCVDDCDDVSIISLEQYSSYVLGEQEQELAVSWAEEIQFLRKLSHDKNEIEAALQEFEDYDWQSFVLADKFVFVYTEAVRYEMSKPK